MNQRVHISSTFTAILLKTCLPWVNVNVFFTHVFFHPSRTSILFTELTSSFSLSLSCSSSGLLMLIQAAYSSSSPSSLPPSLSNLSLSMQQQRAAHPSRIIVLFTDLTSSVLILPLTSLSLSLLQ